MANRNIKIDAFKLNYGTTFIATGKEYICTGNKGNIIYGESKTDPAISITLFSGNEVEITESYPDTN